MAITICIEPPALGFRDRHGFGSVAGTVHCLAGRAPYRGDDHIVALGLGYPADRPLTPINKPNRRPIDEVVHRGQW